MTRQQSSPFLKWDLIGRFIHWSELPNFVGGPERRIGIENVFMFHLLWILAPVTILLVVDAIFPPELWAARRVFVGNNKGRDMFHSIIYVNNQLLFCFTTHWCHGFLSSWLKVNEKKKRLGMRRKGLGGKYPRFLPVFSQRLKIKKLFVENREMSLIQDKSLIWQFGAERSLG